MKSPAVSRIAMPAVIAVIASATTACFASVAQLDEVNEQVETTRAEVAAGTQFGRRNSRRFSRRCVR